MKMIKLQNLRVFIFSVLFLGSINFSEAQTFIELPSISGADCLACPPSGYSTYVGTTDIISGNGPAFPSDSNSNINGISSSGGSMMRFVSQSNGCIGCLNDFYEANTVNLTGLTPGENYILAVEWQQSRIVNFGSIFDGGQLRIFALNSGIPQNYTSTGTTSADDNWQLATYTFTASATTEPLAIGSRIATRSSAPGLFGGAIVVDAGNLSPLFSCTINDPGTISGICASPSNDLEFSLNLTGSNIGATYIVSGATPTTGTYGTLTTFTIASGSDGTNKTITITDNADISCTRNITITGVAACFSCDAGTEGPRFLGLTKSTWMAIGIVSAVLASCGLLFKKIVF